MAVLEVESLLRQLRHSEEWLCSTSASESPALSLHRRSLHRLALLPSSQWSAELLSSADVDASLVSALSSLSERFLLIRQLYRKMGDACGVAIEPPAQTALCDWTQQQPGVVAAAVPGAGGEDAIVVLAVVDPQAKVEAEAESASVASPSAALRSRLALAWRSFAALSGDARTIRPLPVTAVNEAGGVRHESGAVDVSRLCIFRV